MKTILLQITAFLSFLLLAFAILCTHYVAKGECAAIIYYKPINSVDIFLFMAIGVVWAFISVLICKPSRNVIIFLCVIYLTTSIILCVFGNTLLELRTEHWPHEYHPQPLGSNINYTDADLIGCWERSYYKTSTDSVTFLTPIIEFEKDNIFANGDTTFYYIYHLHNDTLTIHRPNNALQEYKVLIMDVNTFTVKLLSHEIFIVGPYEVSDSIILSFRRVENITVPKMSSFSTNL